MKKLLFLMSIACFMLMGRAAKAQTSDPGVTISVFDYFAGSNNYDAFSYYITDDGWLYYSLIDNGPGSTDDSYESDIVIYNADTNTTYFYDDQLNGGNIVGSVYIGTDYLPYLTISHDCGYLSGPNSANAEEWQESVSFD